MDDFFCGLLPPDPGAAPHGSAAKDTIQIYSPADVKEIVTGRTPRSVVFKDPRWIKKGDQTQTNGCAGWSCATAAAKTAYLEGVADQPNLSGSFVYAGCNGGTDNGAQLIKCAQFIQTKGAPTADHCPANLIYWNQVKQFAPEALQTTAWDIIHISTEEELDSAIAAGLLPCVCVQVKKPQFMQYRGPGIIPVYPGIGNHAVHVDDIVYINGQKLYRLVNNWNLSWGMQGVGYVTFASFAQTIVVHYFYAFTSVVKAVA